MEYSSVNLARVWIYVDAHDQTRVSQDIYLPSGLMEHSWSQLIISV
jgi:hypothetical protein